MNPLVAGFRAVPLEEAWRLNTASIFGSFICNGASQGAYSMGNDVLVTLSGAREQERTASGIGVSVLCHSPVSIHTRGAEREAVRARHAASRRRLIRRMGWEVVDGRVKSADAGAGPLPPRELGSRSCTDNSMRRHRQ